MPSFHFRKYSIIIVVAFVVSFFALFVGAAEAASLDKTFIQDDAHVLDQQKVLRAVQQLPCHIDVYTIPQYKGDLASLNQKAKTAIISSDCEVAIMIDVDTSDRRMIIIRGNGSADNAFSSGSNASDAYESAKKAFAAAVHRDEGRNASQTAVYTDGVIALIESLNNSHSSANTAMGVEITMVIVIIVFLVLIGAFTGFSGGSGRSGGTRIYSFRSSGGSSSGGGGGSGAGGRF